MKKLNDDYVNYIILQYEYHKVSSRHILLLVFYDYYKSCYSKSRDKSRLYFSALLKCWLVEWCRETPFSRTTIHLICFYNIQRNFIKSNRGQIAFTIFRLIWNQTDVSVWFQINRKMVNTIWFRFDLIRFGKDFSVWMCSCSNGAYIFRLQLIEWFEMSWDCHRFNLHKYATKMS